MNADRLWMDTLYSLPLMMVPRTFVYPQISDWWMPRYGLTGHKSVVHRLAKSLLDKLPEGTRIELTYRQWTPKHHALFTIDGKPNGIILCKPVYPKSPPSPASRGARLHKTRHRRL